MLTIPLVATASQTLSVTLGSQFCKIAVYQKSTGVFLDLLVNDIAVNSGCICLDRVSIIRLAGFTGELRFVDTQGNSDPDYIGFNTRYKLVYTP